jgi:ABC-type antimicrobial peptide transport system, permease component
VKGKEAQPPLCAKKFLAWYCRPELLEDLEGDLNEYFFRNIEEKGVFYARLIYAMDVIKFLRSYTIRKPSPIKPGLQGDLLLIYSIAALRTFSKRKLTTTISLFSLALGLSCFMIISLYVAHEFSFNRHYTSYERIGRVSLTMVDERTKDETNLVWTNPQLPDELRELYPEVEAVTGMLKMNRKVVVNTGTSIFLEENFFTADKHYFTVFNHEWLAGNASTALDEPSSIVVTESLAIKYFGQADPINKALSVNDHDYKVTGVIRDVPPNTDLRPAALVSLDRHFPDWCMTYILFEDSESLQTFQEKLDAHFAEYLQPILTQTGYAGAYHLERLADIHLGDPKSFDTPKAGRTVLYVTLSIALVILVVTVMNYLVITAAGTMKMLGSIRIRKVFGAHKSQIHFQYMTETFLLSFAAFVFSLVIISFALPILRENHIFDSFPQQWLDIRFLLSGLIITTILSVITGGITSLLANRKTFAHGTKELGLGQRTKSFYLAFLTIHLTVALAMVFSAKVVRNQVDELLNMDPGYNAKQILVIDIPTDTSVYRLLSSLKEALQSQSFVSHVSLTGAYSIPTNDIGFDIFSVDQGNGESYRTINYLKVDNTYFDLFNIRLKEGTTFKQFSAEYDEHVVVNEALVRMMGWNDPLEEYISNFEIVGIVEDFRFYGFEGDTEPLIFRLNKEFPEKMLISLHGATRENVTSLKELWSSKIKGHPFSYRFLDDYFEQHLEKEYAIKNLLIVLTFVSILIAGIGIFGAINIRLEYSMKETGIRKILGGGIIQLLSANYREYTVSIAVACFLAFPLSLFMLNRWLEKFAHKTSIDASLCLESLTIVAALSLLAILYHMVRIWRINPLETIKNE